MSQAVSAPSTGACFIAPGKSPNNAGLSPGNIGQESPSRRAVLAGMMLVPTIIGTAAAATPNAGASWIAAMARFEAAYAAEETFDAHYMAPGFVAPACGMDAVISEADRLTDIRCDAEKVLIDTPSPHLSAVIWKIEYARERWSDFEDWPEDWWDAVMADLRRLAAIEQRSGAC